MNWIEVGSLATGGGAVVTAGLAAVTGVIARRTRAVADRTETLAEETRRLAQATEDDVSAGWRPVLACPDLLRISPNEKAEFGDIKLKLINVGRGPAINVTAVVESRAIQDRVRTPETSFGVVLAGRGLDIVFPGHLIHDLGQRALAFRVLATYADLSGDTFHTELRFMDYAPGMRHDKEVTASLASFDFRPRPDMTQQIMVDADDDEDAPEVLPPQSDVRPYARPI